MTPSSSDRSVGPGRTPGAQAPVDVESEFHRIVTGPHRAGRLDDAAAAYRALLDAHPEHAGALANLGLILRRRGAIAEALDCYRRAAAVPDAPAEVLFNLANAEDDAGNSAAAVAALQRCVDRAPHLSPALHKMGLILNRQGRRTDAIAALRRALRYAPETVGLRVDLARMLDEAGDTELAEPLYRWALADQPEVPAARRWLADLLLRTGRRAEAEALHRQLACTDGAEDPDSTAAVAVADRLHALGQVDEAIALLKARRQRGPGAARMITQALATLLLRSHCAVEVEPYVQSILATDPDTPWAIANLAHARHLQHRIDEAMVLQDRVLALQPNHSAPVSNALFMALYSDALSAADLTARHRRLAHRLIPQTPAVLPARPAGDGRVRLGFVSADLTGHHPVAQFLEPLLRHLDRSRVRVALYILSDHTDATAARLRSFAETCCTLPKDDPVAGARAIAADGVDVLIDLGGHTSGNALPVLAHRPAPVQATVIGYPHSTGMAGIDYLFGDAIATPTEHAGLFTETVLRPNPCLWCLQPPAFETLTPRPRPPGAGVVFGSLNTTAKISPRCLRLWATILQRCPGAMLLVKAGGFGDPGMVDLFRRRLIEAGADIDRVVFDGPSPFAQALGTYDAIDIALDTMPFTGGTTTAQALVMGVPVVTRLGDTMCRRLSASFLTAVDRTDLIATDDETYVEIACRLAGEGARDAAARQDLRQRALRGFCDAAPYTRCFEYAVMGIAVT